jgi:acetyltransferase-like isoleucine patch superfamily enzyme
VIIYPFRRIIIWFMIATPWVMLMNKGVHRFDALVIAMISSRIMLGIFAPLIGILIKWLVIGKYKAGRYPLWGAMYLKWWLVEQVVHIMGKGFFRDDLPIIGPSMVRLYWVLMGAQIGSRVKIHKDAKLGQADLLRIGDDVLIDNATIRPFSIEEGHFVLLPITIGSRCSIGVKTSIAAGSELPSGTCLGPLSSSYETDDAEAHYRDYARPGFAAPPPILILLVGIPVLFIVLIISYLPWYFGLKIMVQNARFYGWYDQEIYTIYAAFQWWVTPERLFYYFLLRVIRRCFVPPLRLLAVIAIKKLIIGKFVPMDKIGKMKPWNRLRYWIMSKLLPGGGLGGVARLVGTHYEVISIIYRMLGAKIGKRIYWPGSGLDLVEYDLLEVGDDVVFGSRSVILTSTASRSARVVLEAGSMVADRCVILPGVILGRGAVLGSGSLAGEDMKIPVGSVWVGSRAGAAINVAPADMSYNVKDTISPFGRAFYNGEASYLVIPLWAIVIYNTVWQGICTCFRNCPTPLALFLCKYLMINFEQHGYRNPYELFRITMFAVIPVHAALCIIALGIDIVGKWAVIGRRQEGAYPWDSSSYCQRWQIYLTLQEIRRGERSKTGILDMIEGSQYLVWYFRLLGGKIGKNVCLYPNGGDPLMTEPDMVTIEDNACVDDASLIAHINTRGIFRLNPVYVGRGAVLKSFTRLLSGASMEEKSILLEHTLVLAGEVAESGSVWQGWPSISQQNLIVHRQRVSAALDKSLAFNKFIDPSSTAEPAVVTPEDNNHRPSLRRVFYSPDKLVGERQPLLGEVTSSDQRAIAMKYTNSYEII